MGMGLLTLADKSSFMPPSESLIERQKMMHHLVDIQDNGQDASLLPGVEKLARQFPQGAYFVVISTKRREGTGVASLGGYTWHDPMSHSD